MQSPSGYSTKEDITNTTKADLNMDNPSTSTTPTTATNSLAVLTEVAQSQSHSSQSSLPNLIDEQNGGNGGDDCPCEEDEEMPPLEDADITEL